MVMQRNFDDDLDDAAKQETNSDTLLVLISAFDLERTVCIPEDGRGGRRKTSSSKRCRRLLSTQDQPHISLFLFVALLWLNTAAPMAPHDDAEDEEANGKDGVVSSHFLCSTVASSAVCGHDDD